jgi:hypothetical protein
MENDYLLCLSEDYEMSHNCHTCHTVFNCFTQQQFSFNQSILNTNCTSGNPGTVWLQSGVTLLPQYVNFVIECEKCVSYPVIFQNSSALLYKIQPNDVFETFSSQHSKQMELFFAILIGLFVSMIFCFGFCSCLLTKYNSKYNLCEDDFSHEITERRNFLLLTFVYIYDIIGGFIAWTFQSTCEWQRMITISILGAVALILSFVLFNQRREPNSMSQYCYSLIVFNAVVFVFLLLGIATEKLEFIITYIVLMCVYLTISSYLSHLATYAVVNNVDSEVIEKDLEMSELANGVIETPRISEESRS